MKDKTGEKIKKFDILLEIATGGEWIKGKEFWYIKLWEYRGQTDLKAYYYSMLNESNYYYHASPNHSFILDKTKLSKDFLFSFYHGMRKFKTCFNPENEKSIYDIIDKSEWKKERITVRQINSFKKKNNLVLETKKDVEINFKNICDKYSIPAKIIYKILQIYSIKKTPIMNGELGISAMQDHINFLGLMQSIKIAKGIK